MIRSKLVLLVSCLGLGVPGLVSAESSSDSVPLAPPGPCAEPREQALRADPVYSTAASQQEAVPVFAIGGAPRDHFDPIDVAGGPAPSAAFEPPVPLDAFRTPCTSPDAGCADLLSAGLGLSESGAQPGDPPGLGGL